MALLPLLEQPDLPLEAPDPTIEDYLAGRARLEDVPGYVRLGCAGGVVVHEGAAGAVRERYALMNRRNSAAGAHIPDLDGRRKNRKEKTCVFDGD